MSGKGKVEEGQTARGWIHCSCERGSKFGGEQQIEGKSEEANRDWKMSKGRRGPSRKLTMEERLEKGGGGGKRRAALRRQG